jgi:hypothetical protein
MYNRSNNLTVGPYAPSILRFRVSFPPSYPTLPPLVTFTTDIFHPLITPLTTYMYTTAIQDSGTVSATDEERLPPGGFSLRHGFPAWFGRSSRKPESSTSDMSLHTPTKGLYNNELASSATSESGVTPSASQASAGSRNGNEVFGKHPSTYDVLRYVRSTFDEDRVMDAIPLEAAGNPGAWQAWRTHRLNTGAIPTIPGFETTTSNSNAEYEASRRENTSHVALGSSKSPTFMTAARKPGEWNWDGVWEMRVKKGVEASIADAELFGAASSSDDLIRFLNLDMEQIETIQENIRRSLESLEPQRRGVV